MDAQKNVSRIRQWILNYFSVVFPRQGDQHCRRQNIQDTHSLGAKNILFSFGVRAFRRGNPHPPRGPTWRFISSHKIVFLKKIKFRPKTTDSNESSALSQNPFARQLKLNLSLRMEWIVSFPKTITRLRIFAAEQLISSAAPGNPKTQPFLMREEIVWPAEKKGKTLDNCSRLRNNNLRME